MQYQVCKGSQMKKLLQLTLYFAMSKNGQTHFKNLATNAARSLKRT